MYQSMIRDVCVVLSCSAVTDSFVFVVQSLRVQLFVIPWAAAHQASVSFTISWSLLKVRSLELVMPSNHLILCRPLLLPPSIFPSSLFQGVSSLHQVAKVLEFQLQHHSFQCTLRTNFLWAPKSLQMVTPAMQLKDACSLEEKL